ncbi:MAG: hypothetical protein E7353_01930 [Clostridiales bacterium]|nr:hypothetical protein [Clostridiales bacterium]
MGKSKLDRIYGNLGEVISVFTYREFIYFIYNLGMDYYDGLNIVTKKEWQSIFNVLKDNYVQYEVEKKINYKEFRKRMAEFVNGVFYKHKYAYEVMMDALTSFGQGNKTAKLKYLIKDFEEHEEFDNEIHG